MKTLVRLVEIQEAMGHLDVAFSEMNYKVEGIDDKVLDIFGKKYPWKDSFEDVVIDVKNWINNFERLTKKYEDKLVEEKENKIDMPIEVDLANLIKFLYEQDYVFKLEYNQPEYEIQLEAGRDENQITLHNSPTDDGEECNISINGCVVFINSNLALIQNQILIMQKIIE